jgi:hypothetical protein
MDLREMNSRKKLDGIAGIKKRTTHAEGTQEKDICQSARHTASTQMNGHLFLSKPSKI